MVGGDSLDYGVAGFGRCAESVVEVPGARQDFREVILAEQLPAEKIRRLEDELAAAQVEIINLNYALAEDYFPKERVLAALREPCGNCATEAQRRSLKQHGWGDSCPECNGTREAPSVNVEDVLERLGIALTEEE